MQSNAGSVDASDVISNINTKASDKQAHLHEIDANDERLYEEIRACEHWQDVVEIVSDELLQADGIHCSTKRAVQALVRLSALSTLPSPRLATSSSALNTDNPVLLALLDLIYSRVPSMKVTQLSATLAALSKLKIQVPVAPLSSICKKCGLAAVQMSARDVVTVINSLASLKASPEMGDMDRLGFRAYSLLRDQLSTADDDTEAQKEGGSRRHPDDAASINSQGISLLFYSSASLGYMNSKLISVASEAAMANLQNFTPLGVSNILWACGKMHHYDEKLVEACLEHVSEKIESYAPREAATIMWALAQLKHHPQEASRPLLSALLARLPSANILDISSSLLCLATFSINPGKQSMSKICNRLNDILDKGQPVQAQNVCMILWSLAMLGETSRTVFSRFGALLPDMFEKGELSNEGLLRQAFQAFICSKLDDADAKESPPSSSSPISPPLSFPPLLMDAMKRSWVAVMQQQAASRSSPSASGKGSSDLVSDLATQLRVRHDIKKTTKDQLAIVDVALRPTEERFVALQVLRQHDLAINTRQMLGSTLFQRRILERNGWEVKYLFLSDLTSLEDSEQPLFMAELLGHIGCKVSLPSAREARIIIPRGSEEERDADIALRDPKNSPKPRRGRGGAA